MGHFCVSDYAYLQVISCVKDIYIVVMHNTIGYDKLSNSHYWNVQKWTPSDECPY
jgi:hypothetical protein